jgi:putative MATE family efflux protein
MTMNAVADGKGLSHDDEMPKRVSLQFDPRTRHLIEAPITPTLLWLAAPNVLVMVVQASVGLIETYFIGKLGTDALAGVALVFPALMLMQMMSAGAMGGGISSAVARALGGGRRNDADALALHALAIAVGFGLVFTVALLAGGPWLYAAMGGRGASLDAALTYSNVVFAGAVLLWLFNSLANIIRGTGNMAVPAVVNCVGAAVLIPLSPCLIFGLGPFPRLAITGGAVAVVAFYALGALALTLYLLSSRSVIRLSIGSFAFRWSLFYEILRVGAVAALITVGTNVTIAVATALVSQFGPAAIAGYGTASRLEYLLIPLVFGLGGPLVAIVGTNIGAGEHGRARRCDCRWLMRGHRPCCCGVPACVVVAIRRQPGHARCRIALSTRGGPILWSLRPGNGVVFRLARRWPARMAAHRQSRPLDHCGARRLAGAAPDQQSGRCVFCARYCACDFRHHQRCSRCRWRLVRPGALAVAAAAAAQG